MRVLCWQDGMGCGNNWTLGWVDGSDSDFYIAAKNTENRLVVFVTTAWILVMRVNSVICVSLLGQWKKSLHILFQCIANNSKQPPQNEPYFEVFYPYEKQICEFEYTYSIYYILFLFLYQLSASASEKIPRCCVYDQPTCASEKFPQIYHVGNTKPWPAASEYIFSFLNKRG